jgi:uncharacterized protein YcaQ
LTGKAKISARDARKLALNAQLLDNRVKLPDGREGIARTIEHLGYVQIDTIAVVERAHHHTLWTRRPDYTQQMLHELQARDRRIFEYWGHAASYLPMSDYRFYLPRMKKFIEAPREGVKKWREANKDILQSVIQRIREEGALGSKDFEKPSGAKRGGWWDWRPAKTALEVLFWQGDLMITERRNFQRIYDLTERVLPESTATSYPSDSECSRFFIKRALDAYGVASEKEIVNHLDAAERDTVSDALSEMINAGEVIEVTIDKIKNSVYYAFPENIEKISKLKKTLSGISILSPFDNLIIQRARTQKLFAFDYALECYTPAHKRKHGYFVLPILYGDKFAGRLDPKADRKSKTLLVRSLKLENNFDVNDRFLNELAKQLIELMKFNNCEKIKLEKVSPAKFKAELNRQIKKIAV